jgi:hypothetical protein
MTHFKTTLFFSPIGNKPKIPAAMEEGQPRANVAGRRASLFVQVDIDVDGVCRPAASSHERISAVSGTDH